MGRYPTGEGWEMEESKEKENSLREEKYVLEGKTQAGGLKKGENKHQKERKNFDSQWWMHERGSFI